MNIFDHLQAEDIAEALYRAIAEMWDVLGGVVDDLDPGRLFEAVEGGDAPDIPLSLGGPNAAEWGKLPPEAFSIMERAYWRELEEIARRKAEER